MINSDLEIIFDRLESRSDISKLSIGGWLVWPALKAHLHKRLLYSPSPDQGRLEAQSSLVKSLGMVFRSIGICIRQYARLRRLRLRPSVLVITENRFVLTSDNKQWHNVFGTLLEDSIVGLTPITFLSKCDCIQASDNKFSSEPLTIFAAAISRVLRQRREVKAVGNDLNVEISTFNNFKDDITSEAECLAIVASFVAHKFVYKTLFSYLRPQAVLGTGLPYRCAEVAAARELDIPILELQHGMFSKNSPEYGWHHSLGQHRSKMPLPNKYLVYGRQWSEALLKNGFWESKDVQPIGSAVVEYPSSSTLRKAHDKESDPFTITLMTQPTAQKLSAKAIERILNCIKEHSLECSLKVKIHPDDRFPYDRLGDNKERASEVLEFHPYDENPIEIILQSDLVIGFTSAALLESAYFSVRTISLSMGVYPEGLASVFPFVGIQEIIPHVASFDELEQMILDSVANNNTEYLDSRQIVPESIIASGFAGNLEREIRLLL